MAKRPSRALAFVGGIVGICGVAATAGADGYVDRAAAPRPFTWTGLYVGLNGGYAWSDDQTVHVEETFTPFGGAPSPFARANFGSIAPAGGFGGVQAGGNWQSGAIVLGVEADAHWGNIEDGSLATVNSLGYTVATSNKVSWFGTVRPRLGVAFDKFLIYGTGGLAWGRVEHTLQFRDVFGFTAADQVTGIQVGYAVGGGLEHAFTPRLSLKVEYQYINLGREHYLARENLGGAQSGFELHTNTETDFHTVRVGLNYKLGADPAVTPYK